MVFEEERDSQTGDYLIEMKCGICGNHDLGNPKATYNPCPQCEYGLMFKIENK
jgi:DNA-directed RNA polymerase subunit RPC12/RpoP